MDAGLLVLGNPSVAIRGGRVLAVGPREEVLRHRGPGIEVRDFGDAAIRPGLADAHVHLVPTGLARRRIPLAGLDLDGVRAAVAARAARTPPGTWIAGSGFHLADLGLGRDPSAADLDDVAPEHPVRLASHDLHALWVSSRALAAVGRDPGSPSYLTEDEVRHFIDAAGREGPEEVLAAARAARDAFLAAGIVEIQDHGRLDALDAIHELERAGELSIRVFFSVRNEEFDRFLAQRDRWPDLPGRVVVNGLKLFLDGALGSRTAWTLSPYAEGGTGHRALPHETALARVRAAAEAGLPTFFHAIGDAAVREALDLAAAFPGLPHRVEHSQLVHPDDRPRFASQGVMASIQPVHLLVDTPVLLRSWGEERARWSFPSRSLLESGAEVRFGSDSPVETFEPGPGLYAATERKTLRGGPLPGDEALSREAALACYQVRPAIETGAPADLTVWERDPATVPAEDLPTLEPRAVFAAGR